VVSKQLKSLPEKDRDNLLAAATEGATTGKFPEAKVQATESAQTTPRLSWDELVNKFYGNGKFAVPKEYAEGNRGLVDQAYDKLFGRAGDSEGADYWTGQLDTGALTPEQLEQAMTNSAIDQYGYKKGASGTLNPMYGNQLFGASAEDLVYADANHMADAGTAYQQGMQNAGNKQVSLLDQLISDSQGGTGMFKPSSYNVGGHTSSYVPRAQRAQATQMADLGQKGFDTTKTTLDSVLKATPLTSPSKAGLSYLNLLSSLAGQEESRRMNDINEAYRREALEKGIGVQQSRIDQQEPGILDNLIGGAILYNLGTTGEGGGLLGKLGGLLD